MKKLTLISLLLYSINSFSQMTREQMKAAIFSEPTVETFRKNHSNACYVYRSAKDYYDNKPIEKMDWMPWQSNSSKLTIVTNGQSDKRNNSDLKEFWFSDQEGFLMRYFDNDFYTVIIDGPICYYIRFKFTDVTSALGDGLSFSPTRDDGYYLAFYSENLNGDVIKWSDKMFEGYLKQYNLLEEYNSEKIKREKRDSAWSIESRKINKTLKYLKIINDKLAKKD